MSRSQFTDTQKEFVKPHTWQMKMHMRGTKGGILIHRCEALKMTRIVETPKVKGRWGVGVTKYLRDDDETEYQSIPELLLAMGIQ